MIEVKIKLLTTTAKLPQRGSTEAAGYDLYADRIEESENTLIVYTGIAIQLPRGYCGLIMPRSSIVHTGLQLGNSVGLLDSDFTGEVRCVFYKKQFSKAYEVGNRVAQLVVLKLPEINLTKVEFLESTDRGEAGFGSTGGY